MEVGVSDALSLSQYSIKSNGILGICPTQVVALLIPDVWDPQQRGGVSWN